jgi:hypothetical protein
VTLITTNALGSDTMTQPAYINVATSPAVFTIVQSADSLYAPQGYFSYQWYFNNVAMAGDTNYAIAVTQSGDYGVVVGNANGCQTGVNLSGVNVGIDELSQQAFNVYPNPSDGQFEISFLSSQNGKSTITVLDKTGQVVSSRIIEMQNGINVISIDGIELSNGVYTIQLSNDSKVYSKLLLINR